MEVSVLNATAIKYRKELLMLPLIGLQKSIQHMTLRPGIQYKETVVDMGIDIELRPHDGELNDQGTITVGKRELEIFVGDMIHYEKIEDLRTTILGEQLVGKTKDFSKHPLELQIIALVVNKISEKLNKALFSAVRNASGTTTLDLFDGFDTILEADKLAGRISTALNNYFDLGTITKANVCDKLRDFYQASNDELQDQDTKLFLPKTIYNWYNQTYKEENGSLPYNQQYKKTFLEGTDDACELVPLVSKKNMHYMELTTKKNMLVGVDQMSDREFVKVREVDNPWKTQFVMKMLFGVQIESVHASNLAVGDFNMIGSGSGA
jgi:hypothetical protein